MICSIEAEVYEDVSGAIGPLCPVKKDGVFFVT